MTGYSDTSLPGDAARRQALVIALTYAAAAATWIVVSDWLTARAMPTVASHWLMGTLKGGAFVLVTAGLLHQLLLRHLGRVASATTDLELLARRSPDMIFRYRLHPTRGFDYLSPATETITGYSPAEHFANPALPFETVHPEDRALLKRLMSAPDTGAEPAEMRWIRKDGTVAWIELRRGVVRDWEGRAVAVEGIARDVTARREKENRRAILEAAVEAATESVVITDADGTIQYVNPAFSRITGWGREDVLGRNPRLLKSGLLDASFYERMWRTLGAGRAFQGRFLNRRADGGVYAQESTITPLFGPDGRAEQYVAVARDVTERELLEQQLQEARRAEAFGQIAGGVAHDFRNLLAIIRGAVEGALVRDRLPVAELEEIDRTAVRGMELVRKLLTLGTPEELHAETVNLAATVQKLLPALRTVLQPGITFHVHQAEGDPLRALADTGAVEQILVNLATNARDALPDGGTVTLYAECVTRPADPPPDLVVGVRETPPLGWIRLAFQDDGVGMDSTTMRHVFEPYFTTKPRSRGTGLGMAMVARLARLQGGAVTISSRPGAGTTVALLLPAVPVETPAGTAIPAPTPDGIPRGTGQLILVVDDEPALLAVQVRALEGLGYRTLAAADGEEAARFLEERGTDIDLVMTDLVMPGRGGKELHQMMGALGLRGTPVVFMSGYTAADVRGQLPEGAEAHFLEKPWTVHELAQRAANALKGARIIVTPP